MTLGPTQLFVLQSFERQWLELVRASNRESDPVTCQLSTVQTQQRYE
ncbi:MAG: hypothetical protein ACOCR6_01515 [archaeon]